MATRSSGTRPPARNTKTSARLAARKGMRRAAPAPPAAPVMAAKQPQLKQVSLLALRQNPGVAAASAPSRFVRRLEGDEEVEEDPDDCEGDEKDCILSQDFFCTPDYITPEGPQITNNFEMNKENITCPKSPEKSTNPRSKRHRQEVSPDDSLCTILAAHQRAAEFKMDASDPVDGRTVKNPAASTRKKRGYVSRSAVALRYRVMPPPCIKNPYSKDIASLELDIFGDRKSKNSGCFSSVVGQDGLSRYHTDFHEIEQIGSGNFSRVFKVLKRIDGCMYAVKQSIRQLRQDIDRRRALMEVQALAALGPHENIVGYYSSWFENEQLYIQMELCDRCLCINRPKASKVEEILEALYQVAKALQFMHERGIAHLDVKPDNIYVKSGAYKLGDFGCATLIDRSLPIEEGDSRYMPQEILNDKYEYLDKVDIFSLGAAAYEIVRGSPLPESGAQFSNLREGKIPLLPGYSMQFQNLLKAMMDPDPIRRPSAKEVIENSIFDRMQRNLRIK